LLCSELIKQLYFQGYFPLFYVRALVFVTVGSANLIACDTVANVEFINFTVFEAGTAVAILNSQIFAEFILLKG